MSDNQLREAFALMKQGDKQGAGRIVTAVLKEDRSNLNAWWLYSHLLDDQDKVVKSLEKVLALNPEHAGARKKLAELRPEYAHLAEAPDPEKVKNKAKAEAYWNQLNATQKPKGKGIFAVFIDLLMGNFARNPRQLVFFFIICPLIMLGAIWGQQEKEKTLPDVNGNTPQSVAMDYYLAIYKEDAQALYTMTCPERHGRVDEMVAEFSGISPEDIIVDVSGMQFNLFHYREPNNAYISIHGVMNLSYQGQSVSIDWDAEAELEGIDGYGSFFERINGLWVVCNPYPVPDLEYSEE